MQSPPPSPPPSPPSPPKKLALDYFDFLVPSKKRTVSRRWRRQMRPPALSEQQKLHPQQNSEFEGGEASQFQASNVSEESSCIEVLRFGLQDDNSMGLQAEDSIVEKSKSLPKFKSKTLVQKCQDVDCDTIESTFGHVISNVVADLPIDSKNKQKGKDIYMPPPENEPPKTSNQSAVDIKKKQKEDIYMPAATENESADETVNKVWNLRSKQGKKKPDEPKSSIIKEKGERQTQDAVPSHDVKIKKTEACPKDKGKKIADKEKKFKWPTFRVELTPEEIEEDLYAMRGKKVTKRPKRRPKNAQKNIDLLALGKVLEQITPETYEVDENAAQG